MHCHAQNLLVGTTADSRRKISLVMSKPACSKKSATIDTTCKHTAKQLIENSSTHLAFTWRLVHKLCLTLGMGQPILRAFPKQADLLVPALDLLLILLLLKEVWTFAQASSLRIAGSTVTCTGATHGVASSSELRRALYTFARIIARSLPSAPPSSQPSLNKTECARNEEVCSKTVSIGPRPRSTPLFNTHAACFGPLFDHLA
eukprot:5876526-Amphidinium_carterae.1